MTPQKKKEFFSIPNLLCYVRILLLPIFVVLFVLERDGWTAAVLLLSAATDVVDGFIARKFHMETELGKFLDPLADKLTQAVVSGCLLIRYPIMWVLFLIILVKESFQAVGGLLMYRRMKSIRSSEWFGKLSTSCFYTVMAYLVIYVIGSLVMTVTADCTLMEAMFDFASSLSTVGLSIGITGPMTNDATLIVEMIGMLLGRLEIFIVVVGFTFGFGMLKNVFRRKKNG